MYFSPKTSADGLVFHYDTGNTVRSYLGEPTTNLLPEGVAATHDAASGNVVTVTDATSEKGPGWKKVTITTRGTNFRTLQWTYITMSANTTYCHSAMFDWGNMRGKNYFIYFDGNGTGTRTYYRPGDYVNAGSELINSTMPDGKFAGTITHTAEHTHAFFIGNSTTSVSGLNDYFYYKEFQVEVKSHPTQFTTGTRSATQGLRDLTAKNTIDLTNVSFDANAQMIFDGTNDAISVTTPSGFSGSGTWTLNTWFKINGAPSSTAYMNVILDMNPTGGSANMICVNWSDMRLQYRSRPVGGSYTDINGSILTQGVWYNATVVKNGTSDTKLYLNGAQDGGTYSGDLPAGNQSTFNIGRWTDGTVFANATIPVISIYNRALTADEVARNFNAIKSRFNIG